MTHPSQLQLSMHADKGLEASAAATVAEHLQICSTCQAQLASIRVERRFLASALQLDAAEEHWDQPLPKFSRPISLRGFAMANLATGLVIWLVQFLWKTLFGELVVNATSWATSIYLPDAYAVASTTALYLIEEGTAMFEAYLGFVVVSLITLTVLGLLLKNRKSNAAMSIGVLLVVVGTMVVPTPVNALEFRRDENVVTIAKTQTIDDTLLVAAETVLIEGVITGDLVVVGRRIDISGTVEGNLVTFAETVTVRGSVGGFALGAASSYDLKGATVGGDLWVAGEKIGVDKESSVSSNATVAGETVAIEGAVAKDMFAFAETVELSGTLGENLEAFAGHVRLLGEAQVGGDLRFRSKSKDRLHRAETAKVVGEVEFLALPEDMVERNRYATVEFYLWQVARLIAAFVVGAIIFWLVPGLRNLSVSAGFEGVKTAGIGFLTVIGLPLVATLVVFTLVGIPLSAIAIAALFVGVYLAKIIVAAGIGRMLFSESDNYLLPLLVGLVVVIVAVNLPFIGGILSFVLTIIGLGLLVQHLWYRLPAGSSGDFQPE